MRCFKFTGALQSNSWLSPAFIGVDDEGIIRYLSNSPPESAAIDAVNGYALPGWMNAHSHAFQYAMAGIAEQHPAGTDDDFWSWREAMYQCALAVDPDQAQAIAAMLYAEMLRCGYTHVAEFHYLHHDKNGVPYANLAEMGERMVEAASEAGISITLVPVFYQKGGFGMPPQPRQRRFISSHPSDYARLLDASANAVKNYSAAHLGYSVHSLRAADENALIEVFREGPRALPFHMHIAEQKKEIQDCLAAWGKRPVEWIEHNLPVDSRFFLIHATHLDDSETAFLARSGATVVLCPSTEGNLGDGIFRMKDYVRQGGHWTIGTDSHIGLQPLEELRMIDYRQRLVTNQRNTFSGDAAHYMIREAARQGSAAMGIAATDHFQLGHPLNAVVYDAAQPLVRNSSERNRTSTLVFAPNGGAVWGTIVNGNWRVRNGMHLSYHKIYERFQKVISALKTR